jgi:hypothetical protein
VGVTKTYRFPAEDEVRLVELEAYAIQSEAIEPFYFAPDVQGGVPYPSGVAVIRPEEKPRLNPPEGWGGWDDAELIWQRSGGRRAETTR